MRFELRASHLIGLWGDAPLESYLPSFSVLVVLWLGSCVFAQSCPCSAILSGTPPLQLGWQAYATICRFYWLRWVLANFLHELASNLDLPDLHLPPSWDYMVSHHVQPQYFIFYLTTWLPLNFNCIFDHRQCWENDWGTLEQANLLNLYFLKARLVVPFSYWFIMQCDFFAGFPSFSLILHLIIK
jgi:hypothetical protein